MPDTVFIEGIRFHGFHGLTRLEREIGVRYAVDVSMQAALEDAVRSDRIADTVDYRKVHQRILEIGRDESFRLIETLAGRIAEALLDEFPISEVRVRVRKETPVLDGIVAAVGVEMTLTAAARPAAAETRGASAASTRRR